jgi:sugar transferase (PEP-CTERM/EpsH1 system associated)
VRILYLAHRVPYPPNKGDKIRSFNEIKHFIRNNEIHLLAFCDDPSELRYADELRKFCCSVTLILLNSNHQRLRALISMAQGKPWTLGYYSDSRMGAEVRKKLESIQIDFVFAYSSSMAPYALLATSLPKILDFVDSDASKWRQYAQFKPAPASWLYSYEAGKLNRFEQDMVQQFDASIFVSAREAAHLSGKIHFIQNGIDLNYFAYIQPERNSQTMIFTGAMDYFPNVDAVTYFARDIYPLVRSKCPDADFLIVGSNPASAVQRLNDLPGVTVTGTVPDIRPYLAKSKVAVVPMRISQGIQNKILEALAAGLPVVTTPAAAAGFSSTNNMPIAVSADAAGIADHVARYLRESLTAAQITSSLHHLKQHFDWSTNLSILDRVFVKFV